MRVKGLPPILSHRARVLILGSMPGAASLACGQYYAHPRNAFWRVVLRLLAGENFNANAALPPYQARCRLLLRAGGALWDVLAACERRGSLDSAIVSAGERANDIPALLAARPKIAVVATNGGYAARALRRHFPNLPVPTIALPSTSPANARQSEAEKLRAWRALAPRLCPPRQ